MPSGTMLFGEIRRPGELHDVVALGAVAPVFAAKATKARLDLGLGTTLLVECELLRTDLARAGFELGTAPHIDAPSRNLSAAEANYLRALTLRRVQRVMPKPDVGMPVRLIPRLTTDTLVAAAGGDLQQAIAWEVAALLEGRTVAEFGLLAALRGL